MKKLETSFFLNRIYFSTRKCMFPTFSKNLPRDYTAALTKSETNFHRENVTAQSDQCPTPTVDSYLLDSINFCLGSQTRSSNLYIGIVVKQIFTTCLEERKVTFTTCLGGKESGFPHLQTGVKELSPPG